MAITLPWPDRRLSPNARVHWAVKSRAVRAARSLAFWRAQEAGVVVTSARPLKVTVTFHPPDRRARDLDNMLAACKAYLDGIAQAWCVDDREWALELRREEPRKGGAVVVSVEV